MFEYPEPVQSPGTRQELRALFSRFGRQPQGLHRTQGHAEETNRRLLLGADGRYRQVQSGPFGDAALR